MAPHTENQQHGSGSLLPKAALGVSKSPSPNAGRAGSAPIPPRGRDLQSAMQHSPTIRVIHIFAPKVIKTDVANFRSTVQRLTGFGKKAKAQRRAAKASAAAVATATASANEGCPSPDELSPQALDMTSLPPSCPTSAGTSNLFWDKDVLTLQRLVGDACGVTDLVRCDSVDSATYSLDSGPTFSGDSTSGACASTCSPGSSLDPNCFSFYPQREMPYSLSEIPAPFLTSAHAADLHYMHLGSTGLPLPAFGNTAHNALMGSPTSHLMDHNSLSSLGFDVDVGLPLPTLSEVACNSHSGSLYDLMPRQHCRLSVQSPYPNANFFENIN